MESARFPRTIDLAPWLYDHAFNGRAMLPAVETMAILATEAHRRYPDIDIMDLRQANFARLLELPRGQTTLDVEIELSRNRDGGVCGALLSRRRLKSMTRMLEHGRVCFSVAKGRKSTGTVPDDWGKFAITERIASDQVYRDQVPFGPAFQTITEMVELGDGKARAVLLAPIDPESGSGDRLLGSPFPLDGAMHVACVLGRRYVDFIPLPVAFARRRIYRLTRPGEKYQTTVVLTSGSSKKLTFDLVLVDDHHLIVEEVTDLEMRKVL
jgi:hypothetical protein